MKPKITRALLLRALFALVTCLGLVFSSARADTKLDAMIGQMLMIGFNGVEPNGKAINRVARQIRTGRIGGVILFDRNIRSPKQVRAVTRKFLTTGYRHLPFVSVDQEGGSVQRLTARNGFTSYPSARRVARKNDPDEAGKLYRKVARELASAGFNLNYGPVVDLNINPSNPIIGRLGRSFGAEPDQVIAYAREFISAHRKYGILTSVKHFPGHGSSRTDSHKRLVDLSETWEKSELEPYRVLAREGMIDTLMVGHLYHPSFSKSRRVPASLSPQANNYWIRDELRYNGVVITDDLEMAAVKKHHGLKSTLIQAINSGNDVLMFASAGADPKFVGKTTGIIRKAVQDGLIPRARIEQAYERIVRLKKHLRRPSVRKADTLGSPTR